MGRVSAIEWTDATWNPWIGCAKVSEGCKNCYMFRNQKRFGQDPTDIHRSKTTFTDPLKWGFDEGHRIKIFTCSQSDFFLEEADEWRDEAWDIIRSTLDHVYLILTKRPKNIPDRLPADWGDGWSHVWLGVSVELQKYDDRILDLIRVPATTRFISAEPLLGPLELGLLGTIPAEISPVYRLVRDRIHWVITGGESDLRAPRFADREWFRMIRDECHTAKVPFFHKQNGGSSRCSCHGAWGCRILDGRTWDEFPEVD